MDVNKMHQSWFAIQVKPRHEFIAARLLLAKGYQQLVPTYRSRRQWSDRVKEIDVPLFTGYVFCRFDSEVRWPVLNTQGVIRVVGNKQGPEPIPEGEMESIRKVMESGLCLQPSEYVKPGDSVRITGGALAGVEGTIRTIRNRRHLLLSVNLVRGSVIVDIDQCSTTVGGPIAVREVDIEANPLPATTARASQLAS